MTSTMNDESGNGWNQYQRLVLSELRRLDGNVEKLGERIDNAVRHERGNRQLVENATMEEVRRIALEVNTLKVKATIYGMLAGSIPAVCALVFK